MTRSQGQSGQVLVIVAIWMVALIGAASLVLLAGSVEWQRNQLQQLADQAALDSALKIGIGCSAGSAATVITEADDFLATQRTRSGSLSISGASCTAPYTGADTFAGALSETVHYPYRSHQQQVEVILTLSLPISFGAYMGATNTTVTRRAVAQQLAGSTATVSATNLSCTGGQFNVGGSVLASNTIALSGSCAVYAHARLDATSNTYSDLGDVSVYASGQTWVGGGGRCVAGATTGSSSAVCADGFELAGHVSTACGTTGTSAFLSAGDAAVNPNPCAAGTAALPVAPVSTSRPPEPNTDSAITATLPGGAACSAAASYSNIVVNGVTVGTGNAAAPTQDANGYVHFKTGCYGYLNVGNLGASGSVANRQTSPESARQRHFVIGSFAAPTIAGTLLVATLTSDESPNKSTPPSASWLLAAQADQAGAGRTEIWYLPGPSNLGGPQSFQFALNPATDFGEVHLTEWTGAAAAPLDQTGSTTIAVATTSAVNATAGATTAAGELVITDEAYTIAAGQTFTPAASYTSLVNDVTNGYSSEYALNAVIGVQSETVTTSQATPWANVIATFKPSGGVSPNGAVLDPGFYYFNGSGFAGGGGICLNGGTLLARDVTLEFVNQAGFSSGTCAAGGGAACAGAKCQFGSTPCSISACPPNAALDAVGGGFTWFAGPCSTAPTGDSAACAGSAWCPAGDRACWNLLIWAPASNTGQIAITGSSAKAWLLGSVYWPGTCTDAVNGTSTLDGTISCGTLSVSAGAGAGTAVGSDYGINTALVEAELVE